MGHVAFPVEFSDELCFLEEPFTPGLSAIVAVTVRNTIVVVKLHTITAKQLVMHAVGAFLGAAIGEIEVNGSCVVATPAGFDVAAIEVA